jgi:hypothetical protein
LPLVASTAALAQFDKGDHLVNAGIGLNSYYSGGVPFGASYEYGIANDISAGAGLDFISYKYTSGGTKIGYNAFYMGARVNYHFNRLLKIDIEKLDIYAGGSIGYRQFNWTEGGSATGLPSVYDSGLYFGVLAGARWYFTPYFGVFLEVGAGGSSNARTGLTLHIF